MCFNLFADIRLVAHIKSINNHYTEKHKFVNKFKGISLKQNEGEAILKMA